MVLSHTSHVKFMRATNEFDDEHKPASKTIKHSIKVLQIEAPIKTKKKKTKGKQKCRLTITKLSEPPLDVYKRRMTKAHDYTARNENSNSVHERQWSLFFFNNDIN
jgi:hypothetical protein